MCPWKVNIPKTRFLPSRSSGPFGEVRCASRQWQFGALWAGCAHAVIALSMWRGEGTIGFSLASSGKALVMRWSLSRGSGWWAGRREERVCIEPWVYEEAWPAQYRPGLGMSGTEENITATVENWTGQAAKTRPRRALLSWLGLDVSHWW